MFLRRKQKRRFLDIFSIQTWKQTMASTMFSRYFRFVDDFLTSMITENPRLRLSFLNKTRQMRWAIRHLCVLSIWYLSAKTPFSHLLCDLPNFRSTDRIHTVHCQTVHSTDRLCRLRGKIEYFYHEPRSIETKTVKPTKRRIKGEIIAISTNKYRCVKREQIEEFVIGVVLSNETLNRATRYIEGIKHD